MCVHDQCGCGADALAVLSASDELADGPAGGFLHGDAFSVGAFAECQLLAVGEAKGHSHSEWYQFDTAPIWTRSDLSK